MEQVGYHTDEVGQCHEECDTHRDLVDQVKEVGARDCYKEGNIVQYHLPILGRPELADFAL